MPSPYVSIAETEYGQLVLFQADNSTGYVNLYYKTNADFTYNYASYQLYDWNYPTTVKVAASGTVIYFTHRGYIYKHDTSDGSTYQFTYDSLTSVDALLTNSGYSDSYVFVISNGSVLKYETWNSWYYSTVSFTSSYDEVNCPLTDLWTNVKHYQRRYEKIVYLTNSGYICGASEYGYTYGILE